MKRDIILSQYMELLGNIGDVESYHILNELRRYVDRFLCESTQNEKFFDWKLFSSIMVLSANGCPEFSGKLAARCFDSLEKIAKNIILFKWRRSNEYSTISKHTSFYREKLTKTLMGFEKIFERLGYILDDNHDVWTFRDSEATSTDNLLKIAVDCFIASIECQIMQTMKNLTSDYDGGRISWSDVVKCRTNTTGSAELCRKRLISDRNFRSAATSSIKNENETTKDLIQCDVDVAPPSSSKNNLIRVLTRNASFTGTSSSVKESETKSKTKWYVENSHPGMVSTLPKTNTPSTQIRPSKNSTRPTTVPMKNSTRPTTTNVRLPKIDAQNINIVSKNLLHSETAVPKLRSHDASPSKNLNSHIHNLQPALNVVKERIKTIHDDAAVSAASPTTTDGGPDGRECPKCRMNISQKDVIICAFCGYYFPV